MPTPFSIKGLIDSYYFLNKAFFWGGIFIDTGAVFLAEWQPAGVLLDSHVNQAQQTTKDLEKEPVVEKLNWKKQCWKSSLRMMRWKGRENNKREKNNVGFYWLFILFIKAYL